jgi:hypothetical protein
MEVFLDQDYQDPARCHAGSYVAEAAPIGGAATY